MPSPFDNEVPIGDRKHQMIIGRSRGLRLTGRTRVLDPMHSPMIRLHAMAEILSYSGIMGRSNEYMGKKRTPPTITTIEASLGSMFLKAMIETIIHPNMAIGTSGVKTLLPSEVYLAQCEAELARQEQQAMPR